MPKILLAAATAAAASEEFESRQEPRGRGSLPAHFTAPGIAGAEVATLQKKNADASFSDYYVDGTLQQILADNSGVVVYAPGVYRINKGVTAASVPVEVSTDGTP